MTSPQTDTPEVDLLGDDEKQKLDLKINVDSPSACERHVTVTVAQVDVRRYFDEAYSELMPKADVPGFRVGRAPRKLVESKFKSEVGDQVKGSLLMDAMTQVTDDAELTAISEPDFDFDAIEVDSESPLTFEFNLEVRPEFDVPKWKGLKLEKPTKKFAKKDVDKQLESILSEQGTRKTVDEKAGEDDFLLVDLSFKLEGKEVSATKDVTLRLKPTLSFADANLTGFAKLMKGCKAGDTKESKVTVSHDSANEELRGKDVDVEIKVKEVQQLTLPELDEATLSKLGDFSDEGQLRDAVESALERKLSYHQDQRIRQQITAQLTESASWELPPDMLRRQAGRELERAAMELRSSGFSEAEIRAHENELRQNSLSSTEKALKEHFILEKIAEDQEIDADPSDYDVEIAKIAMQSYEPVRRVRARLEKQGMMDALRNQIVEGKVIELIKSEADFKEVSYDPDKNEVEAVDFFIGGNREEIPEAKHGGDAKSLNEPADYT